MYSKLRRINLILILLFSIYLLTSCINSDLSQCRTSYNLYIKAEDNSGYDISQDLELTNGKLYLFNQKNRFIACYPIGSHNITQNAPIELAMCPNKSYRAVAWVNASTTEVPQFNPSQLLKENKVRFLQKRGLYDYIPLTPYYGTSKIVLHHTDTPPPYDELIIRRKIAAIHVSLYGVNREEVANDYSIKIEGGAYNSFNFKGKPVELTSHKNSYFSTMKWRDGTPLLVTPTPLKVAPIEAHKSFNIKLFYKNKRIASWNRDHIGDNISPQAGEQINILIDLEKFLNGSEEDNSSKATIELKIKANNWGVVELWEEWI